MNTFPQQQDEPDNGKVTPSYLEAFKDLQLNAWDKRKPKKPPLYTMIIAQTILFIVFCLVSLIIISILSKP